MIILLMPTGAAVSLSCTAGGSEGKLSLNSNYDLSSPAGLAESVSISQSGISGSKSLYGTGLNSLTQILQSGDSVISSQASSSESLKISTSISAIGNTASLNQGIYATGQVQSEVSSSSGQESSSQDSGVLDGAVGSSQNAFIQQGKAGSYQESKISGLMGYSSGQSGSDDSQAKVTGGLNGEGFISGQIVSSSSKAASTSAIFQADSISSKAYSASEASSSSGKVSSYTSADNHLESSPNAAADEHVKADQNIEAIGDVLVNARTQDRSESYTCKSTSGSISAEAGSPQIIDAKLDGDVQSTSNGLIPTPGSWVWQGFGKILKSSPSVIKDNQGNKHAFARGSDDSLWDNKNGDWFSLGGKISSEPSPVLDSIGIIHVLARDGDGSLSDNVITNSGTMANTWTNLGGYITSSPSAGLSNDNHIKIAVKGGDNALWIRDLSDGWSNMGGILTYNPEVIFDAQGKMHVLARGYDGALFDNVDGEWQARGGFITSDPKAILNPFNTGSISTFVRGGDGSLWRNDLHIYSSSSTWTGLGGYILPGNGDLYKANPEPAVDSDGVMHAFVRGGDGALWDNANGNWYGLGKNIISDPSAMRDKNGRLFISAVGSDNGLLAGTLGLDQAPTYLVGKIGCDYSSIQSAVTMSSDGEVIRVLDGTYIENVKIDKSLTIKGVGPTKTRVDGNKAGPVFTIGGINHNAHVTLADMTIQNGAADYGGGIFNYGTAMITGCTITDNTAQTGGGGIYNEGTAIISGSTISGNSAGSHGGGIYNYNWTTDHMTDGTLTIADSTISGNKAGDHGGGIFNEGTAKATIANSWITNNAATHGGGISNVVSGALRMTDSTISGNNALYGGGIFNYDYGNLWIGGTSQITDNQASKGEGGGLYTGNSLVTLDGTRVAIKSNKAHGPDYESDWYQGWGIYYIKPAITGGFDPAMQVTGNTHI